jgi:hypothetical protein
MAGQGKGSPRQSTRLSHPDDLSHIYYAVCREAPLAGLAGFWPLHYRRLGRAIIPTSCPTNRYPRKTWLAQPPERASAFGDRTPH